MSTLYDSDNPDSIPDGVNAAGYVNGYAAAAWAARGWSRFATARRITVFPTDEGDTCDVEWLDLTPEQAAPWAKGRLAAGVLQPWVYCSRSSRPAVEASLAAVGITGDQVALWVATLDGTQTVPAGPYPVAAVQYANSAISGGHYDLSIVNEAFGPGAGSLGEDMNDAQEAVMNQVYLMQRTGVFVAGDVNATRAAIAALPAGGGDSWEQTINKETLGRIEAEVLKLQAAGTGGALTAAQAQQLTDVLAALAIIAAKLSTLTLKAA